MGNNRRNWSLPQFIDFFFISTENEAEWVKIFSMTSIYEVNIFLELYFQSKHIQREGGGVAVA